MSKHPIFLIVQAKIAEVKKALAHMVKNDAQQKSLAKTNPSLYSMEVHAESMATNVQGIYTHFESILKSLANTIDGFVPLGDASHRDLLLQVSVAGENRGAMIGKDAFAGLSQLLKFRHAVRNNYANELRAQDVFDNVVALNQLAPHFFSDLDAFIASFENKPGLDSKNSNLI
jgi:hypothetical protein